MKEILIRLFAHEELSHEEACNLMKDITRGDYNESQIAAHRIPDAWSKSKRTHRIS